MSKKKEPKKEAKEREWADVDEQQKFVCHGGKVQCPFANPPMADIIVTSSTIMLQDKPWASVKDKDGKVNFNFTGVCTHPSQQKPFSPPPPCKAVISLGEWKDFSQTIVGDNNALLVKSAIPCMISGQDLKIIDSGQKAELTEIEPKVKRNPRITKIYWLNDEMEKIDTISAGKSAHLCLETADYKEGETVPFTLNKKDGFENGETETEYSGRADAEGKVIFKNAYVSKIPEKQEEKDESENTETNSWILF